MNNQYLDTGLIWSLISGFFQLSLLLFFNYPENFSVAGIHGIFCRVCNVKKNLWKIVLFKFCHYLFSRIPLSCKCLDL